MSFRKYKTEFDRREFLRGKTGCSLENISKTIITNTDVESKNTENFVGAVQVPLGVAGPLAIQNLKTTIQHYYIPLATTEGALVASVNRGCKAVTLSGGANVVVENIGATRGSVYRRCENWEIGKLGKWVTMNLPLLKKVASETSNHITLMRFDTTEVGKYIFIRWYFDTQDAMGMNMATIASQKLSDFIERKTEIRCISVAGNFDTDKKPSWLNFIQGRGKRVRAEIVLPKHIVASVLKTTPEKIVEMVTVKDHIGSIVSVSLGFNGHYANIIAAIFIATGQDPAHVVDGSLGVTTAEVTIKGDLYFSVYLPDVMIGTVGGGTSLPTQREALELLGVYGGNKGENALQFAKIVGAAVLAGELSLTASLAEGSLVKAHQKLARKYK